MPAPTWVRPLQEAAAFGEGRIGGKARNLQKLGQIRASRSRPAPS